MGAETRGSRSCRRERPAQRALGLPAARSPPAACSRRLLSAMGSRSRHSPGRWHTPASAQVHPGAAMREGRRFPRKRPREFRPPPPADGSGGRKRRARGRCRPAGGAAPAPRGGAPVWYSRLVKQQKTLLRLGGSYFNFYRRKRALGNAGLRVGFSWNGCREEGPRREKEGGVGK